MKPIAHPRLLYEEQALTSYESTYLRRIFLGEKAAEAARRFDARIVYYIDRGHDLMSARELAHLDVRFDWNPQEQADHQFDSDRDLEEQEGRMR